MYIKYIRQRWPSVKNLLDFIFSVRNLVICLTSRNPRGVSSQALQAGIKRQRRHVSKQAEG